MGSSTGERDGGIQSAVAGRRRQQQVTPAYADATSLSRDAVAQAHCAAPLLAAVIATAAQAQTPEGTVITNTATVTFTDANANTYAPVVASANVTVGFAAGISLTGAATASPGNAEYG